MRGTSKAPPSRSKSKFRKRLRTRIGVPAALIAVLVLALPGSASAGLGDVEEFFAPTQPTKPLTLVEGPDGNVWYTDSTVTKIGKVTPSGEVEEFSPGLASVALNITSGPESKLWFTEKTAKRIGSINTSGAGYAQCPVAGEPEYIAAGSDGNLWFTFIPTGEATVRKIAKMTPGCSITVFSPGVTAGYNTGSLAANIIAGDDNNLYFGDLGTTKAIGKITLPGETFAEFTVKAGTGMNRPQSIAYGGDGRIWFATENVGGAAPTQERIGAITTDGVTTTYYNNGLGGEGAGAALSGFATGADGNVWVREPAVRNERQRVTLKTTEPDLGGTYKLKFNGEETESLAFNASAATVEEKLAALASIGGVANVKGLETENGAAQVIRTVEFEGKLARTDVPMMECISALTGTAPSCTVELGNAGALTQRLYRFEPSGAFTVHSLAPRTLGVTPTTLGKMGTLVPGPDNSLWYTTAGDVNFPATTAIGKFDLGIVEGPELTIVPEGTGTGTVVSSPAGIECGGTCSAKFAENTQVTLTASPDSESLFVSWKGCESGGAQGRQCKVTMDAAKTVKAKFEPANDVTVEKAGDGTGSISGVTCGNTCTEATAAFLASKTVTLKAKPYVKNSEFVGWSASPASCTLPEGPKGPCTLSGLTEDQTVEAEFAELDRETLTVAKSGNGQGTVKSSPAGINCSYTCSSNSAYFYKGTTVTLTATVQAGKGSTLGNWGGACSGTAATPCVVTMSEAKEVTVGFN